MNVERREMAFADGVGDGVGDGVRDGVLGRPFWDDG